MRDGRVRAAPGRRPERRFGIVLVIDDDPAVRDLIASIP